MGMLQLDLVAIVLKNAQVQRLRIGLDWFDKTARTDHPVVIKPFACQTPGITSGIGGKVVGALGHDRPVHKLRARVMAVAVGVKNISHRQVARRQHKAALVHGAGQLVLVGLHFFLTSAHAPGLAQKQARAVELQGGAGRPRHLAIGKATKTLQA